jgi:hypothetical protein
VALLSGETLKLSICGRSKLTVTVLSDALFAMLRGGRHYTEVISGNTVRTRTHGHKTNLRTTVSQRVTALNCGSSTRHRRKKEKKFLRAETREGGASVIGTGRT